MPDIIIADVYAKNYIFYEMEMKFKRRFVGEYHEHVRNRLKKKKKIDQSEKINHILFNLNDNNDNNACVFHRS